MLFFFQGNGGGEKYFPIQIYKNAVLDVVRFNYNSGCYFEKKNMGLTAPLQVGNVEERVSTLKLSWTLWWKIR